MHLRSYFQTIHWVFVQMLPEQLNLEGQWEVAISETFFPSMYQNVRLIKYMFLTRNFQSLLTSTIYNLVFTFPLRIVLKLWTLSLKKDTIKAKTVSQIKCLKEPKKLRFTLQFEGSGLAFFSTDLGHIFGINDGNEFGVMLRGRGPHKPEFACDIVCIHSLMIHRDLIEYNIVGDKKAPLLRCFSFISKLKAGDITTTEQYMNYQTFGNL